MKPTFPPDHHFHRSRPAAPPPTRPAVPLADAAYHARHRVALLDPSDPRETR